MNSFESIPHRVLWRTSKERGIPEKKRISHELYRVKTNISSQTRLLFSLLLLNIVLETAVQNSRGIERTFSWRLADLYYADDDASIS